jgi:glyoxylase-like metal-dependent hydrolase (beta-lactamase superfamily II)
VPLADGEVLDLGGRELRTRRVRHLDAPHVPHNWESQVLYEEQTGTLLCGAT